MSRRKLAERPFGSPPKPAVVGGLFLWAMSGWSASDSAPAAAPLPRPLPRHPRRRRIPKKDDLLRGQPIGLVHGPRKLLFEPLANLHRAAHLFVERARERALRLLLVEQLLPKLFERATEGFLDEISG